MAVISPHSDGMANVTEDRLLDCVLNECLTALGCATLVAIPGAWFAYTHGVNGGVGALLAGLLAYALFTAYDHYGRTRRQLQLERVVAELRERLAAADPVEMARTSMLVRHLPAPSMRADHGLRVERLPRTAELTRTGAR